MSRHRLSNPDGRIVVVGYDPPARSYFFQIWENQDAYDADDEPVYGGYLFDELPNLKDLYCALAALGVWLNDLAMRTLVADKEGALPPTRLQQAVRDIFADMHEENSDEE